MATISGTVNNLPTQYSYYITWTESDVNSTNNTSLVTASVYIQKIGSYNVESSQNQHYLYIDGTEFYDNNYVDMNPETTPRLLVTGSKTITHGADGSKSITISGSGNICGTLSYGPKGGSGSGTAVLTNITRATTATTQSASSVTSDSATANGNVTDAGIPANTNKGIYWGTSSGNLPNQLAVGSGGTGAFTKSMTGLSAGTTYYYKAYSYNTSGYGYGSEVSFTTNAVAPTLTTQSASDVSYDSCTGNGNISATGGASVTRRGFCYKTGTSGDPTVSDSVAYDDGTFGTGAYTKVITGLSASTDYRVRAYCINSAGTSYGSTVQVTTQSVTAPTVSSVAVSRIYKTSAIIGGEVTASDTTVSERGIYWGTTEGTQATKVASTNGLGTFSIHLTGLSEDTTYYFKAFGVNVGGTSYGDVLHFKTTKFHSTAGDTHPLPSFELS